jgi:hypothetical protein
VTGTRSSAEAVEKLLTELQPGVTEIVLRPAVDGPELRAVAPDWAERVADHELAMAAAEALRTLTRREDVHEIGYRDLRELQRR